MSKKTLNAAVAKSLAGISAPPKEYDPYDDPHMKPFLEAASELYFI